MLWTKIKKKKWKTNNIWYSITIIILQKLPYTIAARLPRFSTAKPSKIWFFYCIKKKEILKIKSASEKQISMNRLCWLYEKTLGALCRRMSCPEPRVRQRPREQVCPSSAALSAGQRTRSALTRINRCPRRPSLHQRRPPSPASRRAPPRRQRRHRHRRPQPRYLEASLSKGAPPPSATPPRVALTWW